MKRLPLLLASLVIPATALLALAAHGGGSAAPTATMTAGDPAAKTRVVVEVAAAF